MWKRTSISLTVVAGSLALAVAPVAIAAAGRSDRSAPALAAATTTAAGLEDMAGMAGMEGMDGMEGMEGMDHSGAGSTASGENAVPGSSAAPSNRTLILAGFAGANGLVLLFAFALRRRDRRRRTSPARSVA